MNNVEHDSKQNLDTTSPIRRQLQTPIRSERRFLADQAADARTALTRTLHQMKDTLRRGADVRSCVKQHPWLVIGSAVAAGFVMSTVLTRVRRKNIQTMHTNSETESQSNRPEQEAPRNKSKKSFVFSTVVTVLAGLVQTAVNSWIASAILVKDQPQIETQPLHDLAEEIEPVSRNH